MSHASVHLSNEEESMLGGGQGPAVAMAMRVLVGLSGTLGAPKLVQISSAHIDSCLYHGQVSLDFAERLVSLGATVRVPTTLNVGSVDLLHPGMVKTGTAKEREVEEQGRALMAAYSSMGCTPTWTCAPYQLPGRPKFGEHIAWAESNAIAFANSVLGARTDRYGDFLDICAAITGRAPYSGLQATEARRGEVVFDCSSLPAAFMASDIAYALLGYHVGKVSGTANPVILGAPSTVSEDQLKAFGAAAASSGGVAMFHVVGVTPEAKTLDAALQGQEPASTHLVTVGTMTAARRDLSTFESGGLDAVSVGTPHASYAECAELARLLAKNGPVHPDVDFFISTGRATLDRLRGEGLYDPIQEAGVRIVVDTCTYVTTILSPRAKRVMTNSGKWAHYAPANIGVDVLLGSIEECVNSARHGRVMLDGHLPGTSDEA
jgi:predicted aconitase